MLYIYISGQECIGAELETLLFVQYLINIVTFALGWGLNYIYGTFALG